MRVVKSWASLGGSWLPPWSGWETEEGHFNKTAKTLSPVSRTLPRGRATGASLGGSWLPPRSGWETDEGAKFWASLGAACLPCLL